MSSSLTLPRTWLVWAWSAVTMTRCHRPPRRRRVPPGRPRQVDGLPIWPQGLAAWFSLSMERPRPAGKAVLGTVPVVGEQVDGLGVIVARVGCPRCAQGCRCIPGRAQVALLLGEVAFPTHRHGVLGEESEDRCVWFASVMASSSSAWWAAGSRGPRPAPAGSCPPVAGLGVLVEALAPPPRTTSARDSVLLGDGAGTALVEQVVATFLGVIRTVAFAASTGQPAQPGWRPESRPWRRCRWQGRRPWPSR